MPGYTSTPGVACTGAKGSANAMIGRAAVATIRNNRRRTMPPICESPAVKPVGALNYSSDEDAPTLHTSVLAGRGRERDGPGLSVRATVVSALRDRQHL